MELSQGRFRVDIKKGSFPRGWLDTGTGSQGSGHSSKPDRVKETFGKYSQVQDVIAGVSVQGRGLDTVIPSNSAYSMNNSNSPKKINSSLFSEAHLLSPPLWQSQIHLLP